MGKCSNAFYSESMRGIDHVNYLKIVLGLSRRPMRGLDPVTSPSDHLTSYEVKRILLPLTFEIIEIEQYDGAVFLSPRCID